MTTATETRYRVNGMDCAGCAAKIETVVRRFPGVTDVHVSATAGTMVVSHGSQARLDTLAEQVKRLGYSLSAPLQPSDHSLGQHALGGQGEAWGRDRIDGWDVQDHKAAAVQAPSSASPRTHSHDHADEVGDKAWWGTGKGRLTIACGAALAIAWLVGRLVPTTAPWG